MIYRELDRMPDFTPDPIALDNLTEFQRASLNVASVNGKKISWLAEHVIIAINLSIQNDRRDRERPIVAWSRLPAVISILALIISLYVATRK